jgi:hypothetical protein
MPVITVEDLNPHHYPTGEAVKKNLTILCSRVNEAETCFIDWCERTGNAPIKWIVTSGLRSEEQQAEYVLAGISNAVHSKHLAGAAVDIHDPTGLIAEWCKANPGVLNNIGLWREDYDQIAEDAKKRGVDRWIHFQMMGPASGKWVFKIR